MQEDPFLTIKTATLAGNKAEAIRLYQNFFGAGAEQAKNGIDHLERVLLSSVASAVSAPVFTATLTLPVPPDVLGQLQTSLLAGDKARAVQLYRKRAGVGIAEARTAIDLLETELRIQMPGAFTPPASLSIIAFFSAVMLVIIVAYGISRFLH